MGTPFAMAVITLWVKGLFTVTTYSFWWLFPARKILFTISPLLVKNMSPCDSLSKRPIGKIRLLWFTNCTMLLRTFSSVVDVTPTGLFNAIIIVSSPCNGSSLFPFTRTLSPTFTWSPILALRSFMNTTPLSIKRSASRLEQRPLSLINLLMRMEFCCI